MVTRLITTILILFAPQLVQAQGFPIDISQFSDPSSLLTDDMAKGVAETIGLGTDHRAYQSATPLGSTGGLGLDVGVEATLTGVTEKFRTAATAAGFTGSSLPPSLPLPRIVVHKGIGKRFGIGLSYIGYLGYKLWGGDVKLAVHVPEEEGLTWAIRFNYSTSKLGFVDAKTWSLQVLASRPFAFADTYIGVGYQNAFGKVTITQNVPPLGDISVSNEATVSSFMSFLGLALKLGPTGIKLTLEGSYNLKGTHYVGTKLGLQL